jgi:hypothetical protein
MLCILLTGRDGADAWRMRRSVEVLAFHQESRKVEILFGLYVENKLPAGERNYLRMMHRGNVECFFVPAWPLPQHPAESRVHGPEVPGVLQQIYGDLFDEVNGQPRQTSTMTGWDGKVELPVSGQDRPVVWTPDEQACGEITEFGRPLQSETPSPGFQVYTPFTTWELGPFTEPTSFLLTFVLLIQGATYDELVGGDREFTVDGPERLLSRIRYDDLYRVPDEDRSKWCDRLKPFEQSRLLMGEGYDVMILRPPYANAVEALSGGMGIGLGPRQPLWQGQPMAERFITSHQSFSMALRYAKVDEPASSMSSVL